MSRPVLTAEINADAGLFREYLAARYGAALTYGASPEIYGRALWAVRRLARLTGLPQSAVIADAQADYALME